MSAEYAPCPFHSQMISTVRGGIPVACECLADSDVEGEYMKLHSARRGLGAELYRANLTGAQAVLRHSSMVFTNQSYLHSEAGESSDVIDST